ncbi:MAG: MMPL family transporter [Desulfosarcinaceae bacterium]|nr:MMPL family transporter [Desulfosarcinaceae bacterium]
MTTTAIRQRLERWLEQSARWIYRHRLKVLLLMLMLITGLVAQIPRITIDTSMEGFLHETDPAMTTYNAFRDQFGRDEVVIVAVETEALFTLETLERLRALHHALADGVPHLDDITSLVNARNTRGEGDTLIVEDLLETWPDTAAQLAAVRERALANPMYRNLLLSADGQFTTIVIRSHSSAETDDEADILEGFDDGEDPPAAAPTPQRASGRYLSDAENSAVVAAVEAIARPYDAPGFRITIAGSPVVTHFLKQYMMRDMRKFMLLAIGTVAVILFLMFRRISGVVLPLIIVILSLLSTVGIMAITGTPIKVPTQILPSFLLAVGVGTSVHILAIFYQRLERSGDKRDAIGYALGHSGLAVIMTNTTTAAGLLSFATAEVAPIADVGIFAGVGVLLAFFYTLMLLPALLALIPIRPRRRPDLEPGESVLDWMLSAVARFACRFPRQILGVTAVLVAVAISFVVQVRFSHHPLGWFPPGNQIRMDTEAIDHHLRGSLSMEVVIDTGKENGLYAPELLERLAAAGEQMEQTTDGALFVGKAWSVTTILKEIHQALNENRSDYYAIPQDRDLVAQEFLLFENSGSDDLEDVVDTPFRKARLTLKVPFLDAVGYSGLLSVAQDYFQAHFPDADIRFTGMMYLLCTTITNAIHTLARSYITALVVISALMILLIGKVRIGLLSMIPNLTPILLMLALIGATPLDLDLFTMMVASIAIGLAVDDTIHFMHNFRRYYEASGDPVQAVHDTLHTAGRAMLVTTVVLAIGFFIYSFATMANIINFGLLTSFTVIMALLADYLIAPALMVVVNRKKIPHPQPNHQKPPPAAQEVT